MQIQVKLYGTLRRLSNPDTPGIWRGEVPDGLTIQQLVERLGTRIEEIAAAAVNDQPAEFDAIIQDGQVVTLVTPVGGGTTVSLVH